MFDWLITNKELVIRTGICVFALNLFFLYLLKKKSVFTQKSDSKSIQTVDGSTFKFENKSKKKLRFKIFGIAILVIETFIGIYLLLIFHPIYYQQHLIKSIRNGFKNLEKTNLQGANLKEANLKEANLEGADLKYSDLSGANLIKAKFTETDLQGANIKGANLKEADLKGANLQGADLQGADLQGVLHLSLANIKYANLNNADLSWADLKGANLQGANLKEANLSWADLRGANLQGANLKETNLFESDLTNANLKYNYLRRANLQRANLKGADLQGADLRRANLQRANLKGADLQGADLQGADLQGVLHLSLANIKEVKFQGAIIKGAGVKNSIENLPEWIKKGSNEYGRYSRKVLIKSIKDGFKNLRRANLQVVNLKEFNLSGANLSGADLKNSNLSYANLSGANLSGADLKNSNLSYANLSGANLSGADLKDAILIYANFNEANLSGTNLSGLDLRGTSFIYANLSYANLRGVYLIGADLRVANLSYANLNEANLVNANLKGSKLIGVYLSKAIICIDEWILINNYYDLGRYEGHLRVVNCKKTIRCAAAEPKFIPKDIPSKPTQPIEHKYTIWSETKPKKELSESKIKEYSATANSIPKAYVISKKIEKMYDAATAHTFPKSMILNETALVNLLINFKKSKKELVNILIEEKKKKGLEISSFQFESDEIKASGKMKATLKGKNFEVAEISESKQSMTFNDVTEWKWQIKALKEGHQSLHLSITAIFEINGKEERKTFRTYDKKIKVIVKNKIKDFFSTNWDKIATIITTIIGILVTLRVAYITTIRVNSLKKTELFNEKDYINVTQSLNKLADLYRLQGKYEKAEPLYQRCLGIYEKALGKDHPSVVAVLNNLAELYKYQGKYEKAEPLFKKSLEITENSIDKYHSHVEIAIHNRKDEETEPLYKRLWKIKQFPHKRMLFIKQWLKL